MNINDRIESAAEAAVSKVPKDKLWHLGMGVATVIGAAVVITVAGYSFGFALALTTTLVGIAYEAQQKVRKEGEPSFMDAAATAAPGFVAWAVIEAAKFLF